MEARSRFSGERPQERYIKEELRFPVEDRYVREGRRYPKEEPREDIYINERYRRYSPSSTRHSLEERYRSPPALYTSEFREPGREFSRDDRGRREVRGGRDDRGREAVVMRDDRRPRDNHMYGEDRDSVRYKRT